MALPGPAYFADENALGLGKLLRRAGRDDFVYPGHEDLPLVPVGSLDLDWMPVIAQLDLIVALNPSGLRPLMLPKPKGPFGE